MTAPVRFGVVGLDHWYSAIPLARAVAADDRTELVAIADDSIERATEVAAGAGNPRVTTSYEEVVADASIDVIASFVSVDRNPDVCVAAARAGKHLVSVKPLAMTLDEADRIVEAVRAAGVTFTPGEARSRTAGQNQLLHTWVAGGRIGRVTSASFQMVGGLPKGWPDAPNDGGWWVDPRRAPGGGWIDHSLYQIDRMRWLLGEEVTEVSGRVANLLHPELRVEDYGHAILRFGGGSVTTIEDTWSGPPGGGRTTTTILGTEGGIAFDTSTGLVSVTETNGEHRGWQHFRSPPEHTDGLDAILATVSGENVLATVEDAWENLAAATAFYQAAATGTVVNPRHLA